MSEFLSYSRVLGIASLALAGGLVGCGGGSASTTAPSSVQGAGAVIPAAGSSASFGLGFVQADPRALAQLTHIRRALSVNALPSAVDLSPKMPPVGNQGQEGSCVSWASAYAMRGYEAREDVWSLISPKTGDPTLNFSPAFVYNQVNGGHDGGSTIPSALNLLEQTGAATLADMPYIAGQYTTRPSPAAFADATHYKLSSYGYIAPTDLTSMKAQLASGLPVIIAIKVYNNFFSLGRNQVYTSTAGGYAGGHAITAVGYDDSKQAIEIINSWGTGWATGGYGWIGYSAFSQIALEAYSAIDDRGLPPTPLATPAPVLPTPKPNPLPSVKPTAAPATPRPTPHPTATPKPSVKPSPTATPKASR